jgi:hypothetical protein
LLPVLCGTALSTVLFCIARDRELWLSAKRWLPFGTWPTFRDLWITLQHMAQAEMGFDPLSDPDSEFAYPRAVLALRHVGLHHVPAEWLGLLQGVMFTIGLVLVLRPITRRRAIATSLLMLTPAIVLGFERGNLDLLLFTLCAAAAWAWSRANDARGLTLPLSVLVGGAVLKIYPVFGLFAGAFAETRRRRLCWMAGAALVFGYWYLIRSEMALVMAKIPVFTDGSWGSVVAFARLENYLNESYPQEWPASVDWGVVAVSLYGVVVVPAVMVGRNLSANFWAVRYTTIEWSYYWVGAGICCGCFAGANFAYRWVFALLTLPLLFRAMRADDRFAAGWARITIGAMVVGLAAKFSLSTGPFLLVQLANWICVIGLVIGCAALRGVPAAPQRVTVDRIDSESETELSESIAPAKTSAMM